MTIDVKRLRELVDQAPPWYGGDLEQIALSLPALLDVYEAACAWRDGVNREPRSWLWEYLEDAIEAARGGKR